LRADLKDSGVTVTCLRARGDRDRFLRTGRHAGYTSGTVQEGRSYRCRASGFRRAGCVATVMW
jgi:hypothetical protein